MKNIIQTNPWNGLRTYTEGEIIYGRSDEIQALSMLILQSHQTVVYGKSGIGKSSILNAGIFPIVRKRGVFPIYIRFEHNVKTSYIQQIKDAIKREVDKSEGKITITKLVEKSGDETLWEFFHRIEYRNESGEILKPLVVFDQFEEIFSIESDKEKVNTFFRHLADLINNIMPENLSEKASVVDKIQECVSQDDGTLDLGLEVFSKISYSYKSDSDFHFVFTLRDDYLSYLERNTTDTPALKNNRYCLQPINEEQAAEIITQPRPGLVDISVAKLIIEKVTGEKNFQIDGIPEIQVESAILSLYLSRLYSKMLEEGQSLITAELVEAYSENIIDDFYADSIYGLSEDSIKWLENTLVNEDGHRDNRSWNTVLRESGLSKSQLIGLINDKKLLRQFSYGGNIRVEFIHDVLCQNIMKHRQERIKQQQLKTEKRNLLIKTFIIATFIITVVVLGALWILMNSKTIKVIDQRQNLVLSLEESSTVKDIDFWRAELNVIGKYESGRDTILLSKAINKTEISTPLTINTDSCISIKFSLDFGDFSDIGKYENQSVEIPINKIMESPYVKLQVNRDLPDLFSYGGKIVLDIENVDIPLENAIVMIGDNVTVTDSLGNFEMSLEDLPDSNTSVLVAKGSLGCYELSAITDKSTEKNIYRIMPLDSLQHFNNHVLDIDSISKWNYSTVGTVYCANIGSQNGLYIKFEDGYEDRLKMYWRKGEIQNDKILLSGYFYFKSQKERLDSINSGKYAFYIGTGYIDRKLKKDENNASYRNFEFKGYDAAANLRIITGKYYTVKGAGKYSGVIISNKRQIASFGKLSE